MMDLNFATSASHFFLEVAHPQDLRKLATAKENILLIDTSDPTAKIQLTKTLVEVAKMTQSHSPFKGIHGYMAYSVQQSMFFFHNI